MLEDMTLEHKPEYTHVVMTGTFNLQRSLELFDAILAACAEHGQSKALIDIRQLEGEIPMLDRFKFGQAMAHPQKRAVKITFVASKEQIFLDGFLANVARNRGVITIVTPDIDAAMQWLGVSEQSVDV